MKTLPIRRLLLIYIPSVAVLAAIAVASILGHIDINDFTRDIAAIANVHPLTGVLSNLGILLWCATASICFFAAAMGNRTKQPDVFWFLLVSGCLTAYMLLDDLFMFHELLIPRYLGFQENTTVFVLALAVMIHLFVFRRTILKTHYGLLLLALIFLATSAVTDEAFRILEAEIGHWEGLIEDGAKWLGIVSWCTYFVHTAGQFLLVSRQADMAAQSGLPLRTRASLGPEGGHYPFRHHLRRKGVDRHEELV